MKGDRNRVGSFSLSKCRSIYPLPNIVWENVSDMCKMCQTKTQTQYTTNKPKLDPILKLILTPLKQYWDNFPILWHAANP